MEFRLRNRENGRPGTSLGNGSPLEFHTAPNRGTPMTNAPCPSGTGCVPYLAASPPLPHPFGRRPTPPFPFLPPLPPWSLVFSAGVRSGRQCRQPVSRAQAALGGISVRWKISDRRAGTRRFASAKGRVALGNGQVSRQVVRQAILRSRPGFAPLPVPASGVGSGALGLEGSHASSHRWRDEGRVV